ncbi:MAG: Mov34/MPN/PAD-1 family protein [Marinobacter sp.]
MNCLGEWHTHPERLPKPSDIDLHAWQAFNEGRRGQLAVFLIAGISEVWAGG